MSVIYKKHERVIGTRRERLVETVTQLYAGGMPIRQIAALVGRSYGSVHKLLLEGGVTLRPRGLHRP